MKKMFYFMVMIILGLSLVITSCGSDSSGDSVADSEWNRSKLTSHIVYEADGVKESSNITWSYDAQGREIGYTFYNKGKLWRKYRDYSYNDKECTYTIDNYDAEGINVTSSSECKIVYYDEKYNRGKLTSEIYYETDGVTESSNTTRSYDALGRPVGITNYYKEKLNQKTRDYSYNGKECTYICDDYDASGVVVESLLNQGVFYDEKYIKITYAVEYYANGVGKIIEYTYSYDTHGREIGIIHYNSGRLSYKTRDYSYNGKECTYISDSYDFYTELVTSSTKYKIVYY